MPELLVSCQELSKAFGAAPLFEGSRAGSLILAAEERLEACRGAAADPSVAADHMALAACIDALA
ncbi:MAG TPA: hypothetical protein VLL75_10275 [Vicinamibacteria bacterium]|nr:hypothetical protein [Vicinamibacteria bacterium]